ncbi:MAG: methyl-accepting chemotaxis protein [Kineosporiaceae bacterium]
MTAWIPRGIPLDDTAYAARHRAVATILAAHLPVLALVLVWRHAAGDVWAALVLAGVAWAVSIAVQGRRARALAATTGLILCSDVLVHAGHGLTDLHFHFFVAVGVISLYQDWVPFAGGIGLIAVHHVGMGLIEPDSVFSTPQAQAHPLQWALFHAFFVLLLCGALLLGWHFAEVLDADARRVREAAETAARERAQTEAARAAELAEASETMQRQVHESDALRDSLERTLVQVRALADEVGQGSRDAEDALTQIVQVVAQVRGATAKAATTSSNAREASRGTATTMQQLAAATQDIADIASAITSIAEQTNLLALNATIEAARAGEAGKGFAVVANEVKELASETSAATDRITRVLATVQERTQSALDASDKVEATLGEVEALQSDIAEALAGQESAADEARATLTHLSGSVTQMISSVTGEGSRR